MSGHMRSPNASPHGTGTHLTPSVISIPPQYQPVAYVPSTPSAPSICSQAPFPSHVVPGSYMPNILGPYYLPASGHPGYRDRPSPPLVNPSVGRASFPSYLPYYSQGNPGQHPSGVPISYAGTIPTMYANYFMPSALPTGPSSTNSQIGQCWQPIAAQAPLDGYPPSIEIMPHPTHLEPSICSDNGMPMGNLARSRQSQSSEPGVNDTRKSSKAEGVVTNGASSSPPATIIDNTGAFLPLMNTGAAIDRQFPKAIPRPIQPVVSGSAVTTSGTPVQAEDPCQLPIGNRTVDETKPSLCDTALNSEFSIAPATSGAGSVNHLISPSSPSNATCSSSPATDYNQDREHRIKTTGTEASAANRSIAPVLPASTMDIHPREHGSGYDAKISPDGSSFAPPPADLNAQPPSSDYGPPPEYSRCDWDHRHEYRRPKYEDMVYSEDGKRYDVESDERRRTGQAEFMPHPLSCRKCASRCRHRYGDARSDSDRYYSYPERASWTSTLRRSLSSLGASLKPLSKRFLAGGRALKEAFSEARRHNMQPRPYYSADSSRGQRRSPLHSRDSGEMSKKSKGRKARKWYRGGGRGSRR